MQDDVCSPRADLAHHRTGKPGVITRLDEPEDVPVLERAGRECEAPVDVRPGPAQLARVSQVDVLDLHPPARERRGAVDGPSAQGVFLPQRHSLEAALASPEVSLDET